MNEDVVNLVYRPYGDLVGDILTSVVGGVVNEPIVFDLKIGTYPLAEPAGGIRGITGTSGGAPRTFLLAIDFTFSGTATNSVIWLEDGTHPDDESTFYVDYFRLDTRSPLSDINVGSVTRTLTEAIGREIAVVYQQINLAYLSAFVDTATGTSLDYVVAILGVTRKSAEFAEGLATFFRAAGVDGNINIPAGTRLATSDAKVFTTTQPRTLQTGQVRIDAPIRADVAFAGDDGLVAAGAISEMTQPIAGIENVSNLDPTIRAAADETDDELRTRAKAALRSLGKATLAALDRVIREGRGTPVEFFDPNSPLGSRSEPGTVTVVVDAEPERLPSLTDAVHATRAAGVVATLVARYVFISPRVRASITAGLSGPGQEQVRADIVAAAAAYVDGLTRGEAADGATLLAAIRAVPDVQEATIVDVVVARADLAGPEGDAGLVDALVQAIQLLPDGSDDAALRAALATSVATAGVNAPTTGRIPDRSLLVSTAPDRAGEPATDAEIEAGTFAVRAEVSGEQWWIALDMTPADVATEDADA
ncbi:baseplate J/gp47 family protein [Occultella kanbiaonis]|uniref:baseplate J/gp47 family protein n=1 Tax=Occultella kanbiaonis TaxID=2675754 RepID=UPI0013D3DA7D|nr:baseplate J/gp47 family protein [Occultella kanbiaonis]